MYPLYFLLVIAIFVFIERVLAIKKVGTIDPKFMLIIKDNIMSGNVDAAKSMAKSVDNPVAKMIEKGLMRIGKPTKDKCRTRTRSTTIVTKEVKGSPNGYKPIARVISTSVNSYS